MDSPKRFSTADMVREVDMSVHLMNSPLLMGFPCLTFLGFAVFFGACLAVSETVFEARAEAVSPPGEAFTTADPFFSDVMASAFRSF